MKLFNKTIDRQLFSQYSLGSDLSKQEVVVKIFNPQGAGTWFILNSDPEDPDYLWAIVDLGYGAEVGSVSRSDLENYRGRFGLGFERDLSFDPINALELYQGLLNGEYYADGGNLSRDRKFLNHRQKYEVRYSKGKNRKGYGGLSFADGGEIEVVYERRADLKKKPIKLLLLSRGREQKGYTFSGKDQVAVLENYNRNNQEDLEKLWNLKGYETKYADGGDIENFSDNQRMIMNQNVEVEHHHEELEDILEDEVEVPAWVVAKMETATQNLSDITHYLDGEKELMKDENEEEYGEFDYSNLDDDDEIKNKEVVEPINVSAGTKAELTKKFTDDAWGNLRGFLKGMEGIDLRDDYTFDYKDEQFEVEPIINSDENGVSNVVFSIFNGDGEEVGEVAYSRDGGKQKFTANSDYFQWNNAKFEDGGFINGVYADGGYFDGTIPSVSSYMNTYAKGGDVFERGKKSGWGNVTQEEDDALAWYRSLSMNQQRQVDNHLKSYKSDLANEKFNKRGQSSKDFRYAMYKDKIIHIWKSEGSPEPQENNSYAKGGEVAKAEILGLSKNILGTTSIEMKITGMRKSQDFIVYPISKDDTDKIITIQSSTRIGKIDLSTGRGLMSQSHSNGAYFVHFQMDKLTPFTVSESDLEDIKAHIFKTAGDNVGSRGIVSDNSGASGVYAKGGVTYFDDRNQHYLSRPSGSFEKEIYAKVKDRIDADDFVGSFGWKIGSSKKAYMADGFLYKLDNFDQNLIKDLKLKQGEKVFRYVNRTTAIGGMMPFIKINIEKALLYFPVSNDNDDIIFETKGVTPLWINLIQGSFANGGGIGFIPIDLEETLRITAKWGGTDIKGVIGILNAMIDSGLTDEDLKPKPTKSGTAHQNAIEKKANELWVKIEPQYKGNLKGNMPYSTIRRLVDRANSSDDILKRFKPFRKNQKDSFADGGKIKLGDVVEVKEPNYGYDETYYVVDNKAGYDEKGFLISETRKRVGDVFEEEQLNKLYADGGFMNDVYANGGSLEDKLTKLENKKSDLESRLFDAQQKSNAVMNNIGFGAGMRRSKVSFSTSREDSLKERIKVVEKEIKQTKQDLLPKKPKYILKADIKTVTVKRNGKEVTYKGADVLNGANVLAKGGDISSKANYIPKRDVIEVELKDGTTVKPANGYWVKKGAEPVGAEPTPTSSGSSEPKISTTEIRKDMRGNWRAETTIDNFNGYDWRLSTIKTYSGNLVSSAQGGKTEATGSKGISMFIYTMYQDPNYTLEVSKPKRLTDKVVTEQHDKALAKFKKFMETGMFKDGGKISNFDKLSAKVAKEYEGKPVQSKYQEEYGKYYSKEEAQEVGDKVAGKVKAMQTDKKVFGGLFGGAKKLVTPSKKYPNISGKQVVLKSGKYVQVFEQFDNKISVVELGKIGSGVRPHYIDISEVDMDSFKAGGKIAGKRVNDGTETLKRANELAKKIRKDGESWLDAKKRAFAELKK